MIIKYLQLLSYESMPYIDVKLYSENTGYREQLILGCHLGEIAMRMIPLHLKGLRKRFRIKMDG